MKEHWDKYANVKKWLYKTQPTNVLEIGALDGSNTKNLASVMNDIGFKLTVISDDVENKIDGVEYIKGISYLEIPKLEDRSIDFVILDTDHNYWTMHKELQALHPKLKADAIIMIHDVDYYYYNVGMGTFYADGTPYPKEEIEKANKEFGGMGHAVIDFLSQGKQYYQLLLWIPEDAGCAVIKRLPDMVIQLVLRPGYEDIAGRKAAIGV